MQQNDIR